MMLTILILWIFVVEVLLEHTRPYQLCSKKSVFGNFQKMLSSQLVLGTLKLFGTVT